MTYPARKVSFEKFRRALPAEIAIDALIIDIELTWHVLTEFVSYVCHMRFPLRVFCRPVPPIGFAERTKLHAKKALRDWGS